MPDANDNVPDTDVPDANNNMPDANIPDADDNMPNANMPDADNNMLDYTEDLADTEDTNVFDIITRDVDLLPIAPNPDLPNATLSSAPPPEGHIAT